MSDEKISINTVGDVSGSNIDITQIYAPGTINMRWEEFPKNEGAAPFSIDWLMYSQQSVPLIARGDELLKVNEFLHAPTPFSWWTIVGEGGTGKSRLAFEVSENLPEDWVGGFAVKEAMTLRDAATWRPETNTLWIIDDAAFDQNILRQIISAWEQLFRRSEFKVRLLLIERGYSKNSGWWNELTGAMHTETVSVNLTLYKSPLSLMPLTSNARTFLTKLSECIPRGAADRLLNKLDHVSDEDLMEQSQYGNPLLLELLASQLVDEDTGSYLESEPIVDEIVGRHLSRELDLLKKRCEEAGLRFRSMIDLLFITTSVHPIGIIQDHDPVVLYSENNIFLIREENGERRIPTAAEAKNNGFDVERRNRETFDTLSKLTNIDDVEEYLSVLDEAGLGKFSRYSMQPDLVGEALLKLVFNTPNVPKFLKRRRGEHDRTRVTQLAMGCWVISMKNSCSTWARLDDETLLTLLDYFRLSGNSIRWVLLALRDINLFRSTKVRFAPEMVFAQNSAHSNAPEVGKYYADVVDFLKRNTLDDDTTIRLALSEHAWLLPYVDDLGDLSNLQRARLGTIICKIEDAELLNRLTNLQNFFRIINGSFVKAFTGKHDQILDSERHAFAALADAAMSFATEKAYPIMVAAADEEFKSLYSYLGRMLNFCGFGVANQLFGRSETQVSRQQARNALEIARHAFKIAQSDEDIAYVDRNYVLLEVFEVSDPRDMADIYLKTLDHMQNYADANGFTGLILDSLLVASVRDKPEFASYIIAALSRYPTEIILGEKIVEPMVLALQTLIGEHDEYERIENIVCTLCTMVAYTLRGTKSEEAAQDLLTLFILAVNASGRNHNIRDQLIDLFVKLRECMDKDECSSTFIGTILKASGQCRTAWQDHMTNLPLEVATKIPFDINVSEVSPTGYQVIFQEGPEKDLLSHIGLITSFTIIYTSPDQKVYVNTNYAFEIDPKISAEDHQLVLKLLPSITEKIRENT